MVATWAEDADRKKNSFQVFIKSVCHALIDDDIIVYCSAAGKSTDGRKPISPDIYNEIYSKF